uniref:Uncharacterized protein n=1 Tax=Tanacetum cinerariifolium TaxID=118510 RepID=A0A699TZP2_TANCI|nr:hypothetical protein [Tanacetum cinerariifolium]
MHASLQPGSARLARAAARRRAGRHPGATGFSPDHSGRGGAARAAARPAGGAGSHAPGLLAAGGPAGRRYCGRPPRPLRAIGSCLARRLPQPRRRAAGNGVAAS